MNLNLRKIMKEDIEFLFELVNDSSVRRNSFNSEKIGWNEHQKWFLSKILSSKTKMFILEKNKTPIGQIRFDLFKREWEVDYAIIEKFRGMGLGKKIIKMGIEKLDKSTCVVAKVKSINAPSNKIFKSLNFYISSSTKDYIIYKYIKI